MKTIIITGFYSTFILFYPNYLITMTVLLPSLQSNSPLIVQKPCGLGLVGRAVGRFKDGSG